ncbi:YfbK domain-containing protein [Prosthecobacter vanneervenii]|uniref:Anti-sigma factor RsiW n=1 Tax=Prosthecobacter vanneervenii TaxID=48466 RepID=A0A7W7Y7W1_9BACT|nr:YfbK domain-containing protein [Prosthecobacter vanneervenii]MBB5031273.1 anti-sigma factor RsiW [Prosthecobacter vanneervenii]
MNPLQDNPHFTAYALGELSGEEARAMHEMLATTPAAAHELEQIEAVTDALRHGAPIPLARLTHEQRHAVLHPSNLPRRIQPMMPRPLRKPAPQLFWPVMGTLAKIAAVLALTGAAFFAGWSFAPDMRSAAEQGDKDEPARKPDSSAPQLAATAASAEKLSPKSLPSPAPAPVVAVAPAPVVNPQPVEKKEVQVVAVPPAPAPAAVPAPVVAVAKADPAPVAVPAPAAKVAVPSGSPTQGFAMASGHGSFVSTTKQAADQFSLRPAQLRPPPPAKPKGEIFASPAPQAANTNKPEAKAERPSLYIHSWKAEVASCPWNPAHRLMRVVIQLPADQSAVLSSDAAFPVQVSFDQANVKQYRMLCERHLAAPERRSAGSHVLWYEFQPNGTGDNARQVATVTLPNSHFTSQTVGPFDSSKLQVIDRGYSLLNAREDFVFETSVVGFGLLLRGADHLGSLNHDLVLNLAKQAKGTDTSGERTRFIHLVQDARRAAGL